METSYILSVFFFNNIGLSYKTIPDSLAAFPDLADKSFYTPYANI
jgi:hypothetical protein